MVARAYEAVATGVGRAARRGCTRRIEAVTSSKAAAVVASTAAVAAGGATVAEQAVTPVPAPATAVVRAAHARRGPGRAQRPPRRAVAGAKDGRAVAAGVPGRRAADRRAPAPARRRRRSRPSPPRAQRPRHATAAKRAPADAPSGGTLTSPLKWQRANFLAQDSDSSGSRTKRAPQPAAPAAEPAADYGSARADYGAEFGFEG